MQHCCVQHVARVWSPCCDMLPHVGYRKLNQCACLGEALLHKPGQTTTTSCNILKCCMENLIICKFDSTALNIWQHVATNCKGGSQMHVTPPMLRHVAFKCCDHLAGVFYAKKRGISSFTWPSGMVKKNFLLITPQEVRPKSEVKQLYGLFLDVWVWENELAGKIKESSLYKFSIRKPSFHFSQR